MTTNDPAIVVDCSRPATFAFWFGAGIIFTVLALSAQSGTSWASMLRVGSTNPALSRMQGELGTITSLDETGHDGQLYYLIARDPFATGSAPEEIAAFDNNGPRYRYRRILFPLLAGGFGQFNGHASLVGMISLVVIGMGLSTVAVADLAWSLRLTGGSAFLASLNIGALISALILTADALALGLALSGLALSLRGRSRAALLAFALAALTKEVYVLVPLGLALWHLGERRLLAAASMAVIPVLPLAAWTVYVSAVIPETLSQTSHLGLPFVGISASAAYWKGFVGHNYVQLVLAAYALFVTMFAAAMVVAGRSVPLRCVALPWILLALCSTANVWRVPGNAARAFPILWPISILLVSERLRFASGSSIRRV